MPSLSLSLTSYGQRLSVLVHTFPGRRIAAWTSPERMLLPQARPGTARASRAAGSNSSAA